MTSLLFWVATSRVTQLRSDFAPSAYVFCSILMTFSLSYGLSVRLHPGLGWTSGSRIERWTRSYMKFGPLPLLLVLTGDWRIDTAGIHALAFVVYYGLTLIHMIIVHYVVSFEIPVDASIGETAELTNEQKCMIEGIHLVAGCAAVSALLTVLLYLLFRWDNETPNHATVFATVFGMAFGLMAYARSLSGPKQNSS